MKRFLTACLASAFVVACTPAPESNAQDASSPAVVPPSELAKYTGVYAGSYVCSLGENGITISIDTIVDLVGAETDQTGKIEGRLWFYDVAGNTGHPKGAFKLSGTITGNEIDLEPAGWISDEPMNWGAAGVEGQLVDLSAEMMLVGKPTGFGTSGCSEFALQRLEGL